MILAIIYISVFTLLMIGYCFKQGYTKSEFHEGAVPACLLWPGIVLILPFVLVYYLGTYIGQLYINHF